LSLYDDTLQHNPIGLEAVSVFGGGAPLPGSIAYQLYSNYTGNAFIEFWTTDAGLPPPSGFDINVPSSGSGTYSIVFKGSAVYGSTGPVPEPTSLALLVSGIGAVLGYAWRRRKQMA